MQNTLLIGIGGLIGALARYSFGLLFPPAALTSIPYATLTINVLGSIGIGFLFSAFKEHAHLTHIALFIGVGFLGAFTTFSTFSFETVQLIKRGDTTFALLYIGVSVALGLLGVWIGDWAGRFIAFT